jgi:hypothetical protein
MFTFLCFFQRTSLDFGTKHELNGHAIICCVCVFVCMLRFFLFWHREILSLNAFIFSIFKNEKNIMLHASTRHTIHAININGEPFTLHKWRYFTTSQKHASNIKYNYFFSRRWWWILWQNKENISPRRNERKWIKRKHLPVKIDSKSIFIMLCLKVTVW